MAELELPKLAVRVRFPSPAPPGSAGHQPAAFLPRHRRRGRASRRGRSAGRLPVPVEDTQSPERVPPAGPAVAVLEREVDLAGMRVLQQPGAVGLLFGSE